MNDNAKAITILCSTIGADENIKPLTPSEWNLVATRLNEKGLEPKDVLFMSKDQIMGSLTLTDEEASRILRLVDRSGSISFEIEKYENIGIRIVTRADNGYPAALRKKLKQKCPPLFYVAGDLGICNAKAIGFVGSRSISMEDMEQTRELVARVVDKGYAVVSGGARGVDLVSQTEALARGGKAIVYVADSILRKIKDPETIRAIKNRDLVLLSVAKPNAGFNTGIAMMRNKYIYAQSDGTVVIRSDYNKGGTWSGAIDNLKNRWCTTYCLSNEQYKGNMELIKAGATPIDRTWDVQLTEPREVDVDPGSSSLAEESVQLSMFESLASRKTGDDK